MHLIYITIKILSIFYLSISDNNDFNNNYLSCIIYLQVRNILFINTRYHFLFFSLTVNVNSQACNNAAQYSACSTNTDCECLLYPSSDSMGICTFLVESCSGLVPCESSTNTCVDSGHICVRHPRCNSLPLCYPSILASDSMCPLMIGKLLNTMIKSC